MLLEIQTLLILTFDMVGLIYLINQSLGGMIYESTKGNKESLTNEETVVATHSATSLMTGKARRACFELFSLHLSMNKSSQRIETKEEDKLYGLVPYSVQPPRRM
jgi:hypothetical protein